MSGNFWDTEASGQATTSGTATGQTTSQMQTLSTFTGASWDIADVDDYATEKWSIVDGSDYPRLGWQGIWDYTYRMELTIDATKIDDELTDFPVLVKLTSTEMDFTHARADGHDIRFTDANGVLLAYEVERWDSTSEVAEVWVKIPVIDDTTDTVFYMYYGKPLAGEAQNPAEVWNDDFEGAYLMIAGGSTTFDNSAGTGTLTGTSATSGLEAPISQPFEDWHNNFGSGYTFVIWHDGITLPDAWHSIFYLSDTVMSWQRYNLNDWLKNYHNGNGTEMTDISTSDFSSAGMFTAIWTGTELFAYVDDTQAGWDDLALAPKTNSATSILNITATTTVSDFFVLNDNMSAAWIKAFYNSLNNTLLSYGSEEDMSWSCGDDLAISHDDDDDVAPADASITYGTVLTDLTGSDKCWITRNLGATTQASSATDSTAASAGWYWQFNRKQGYSHDGSTLTPSWTITSIDEDSDWTSDQDPCTLELGAGWRLPTSAEWTSADSNGSWSNYTHAYASVLKLHAAGFLVSSDGSLLSRGSYGYYWSSTQYSSASGYYLLILDDGSYVYFDLKAFGFSGRCLKD